MKKSNFLILMALILLVGGISVPPSNNSVNIINSQPSFSSTLNGGDVAYLIITPNAFSSSLEELALWKSQKGLNAEIVTMEYITANYAGYDDAAKIKTCIKDYYLNNGTEFVLLAGDHQDIPTRLVYVDEGYPDGDYVGCDSYYGNMNDWDSNDNHIYAEDADDWNLTADVYVGRLSANDASEMEMLADRIVLYETNPPVGDWMNNALFAGAMTYFNGDFNYPSDDDILDYPEGDSNRFFNYVADQFYTDMNVTHLAEALSSADVGINGTSKYPYDAPLTATSLETAIQTGASVVGVCGHGNAQGIYRTIWDIDRDDDGLFDWYGEMSSYRDHLYSINMIDAASSAYTNPSNKFSISYLLGCSNGNFTTPGVDSLVEYMLKTVSIGSIGADRIVWGEDGWTEREFGGWYSEGLSYRFFEQLRVHDQPGKAFALAKQDYCEDDAALNMESNTWIYEPRWSEKTVKHFNYFGDPELHVWMDIPETLQGTMQGYNDSSVLLDVTDGTVPIGSAVVTVTDNLDEVVWEGMTDESGQVLLPFDPTSFTGNTVVVSKPTYIPYITPTSSLSVPVAIVAPELLTVSPGISEDGIIFLDWSYVPSAEIYYVYRETSEITSVTGLTPIVSTDGSSYQDLILENGLYYYAITAENSTEESDPSNSMSVIIAIPSIPSAPTLFEISPQPDTDGVISLNWDDVDQADEYRVYRATSEIANLVGLTPIAIVPTSNYMDTGLVNGTYYYVVTASNELGESELSNNVIVTVAIPSSDPDPDLQPDPKIPGYNLQVVIGIGFLSLIAIATKIVRKNRKTNV